MSLPLQIVSCPTGFGSGGLGQHLAKIHKDALSEGKESRIYCHSGPEGATIVSGEWERAWFRWPPFRWRPDLRVWWRHERFDRGVAAALAPSDSLVCFMGGARNSFRKARELGTRHLVLEMPNTHPSNVRRLHEIAARRHGFERSWMGGIFEAKAMEEFAMADEIRTNSDLTTQSLIERGVPASKIVRRHLGCDPRFASVQRKPHPQGLKVAVAVGSLSVAKGIPFLVEAFRKVPGDDLRLLLIGGWSTRPMHMWLRDARRIDPRLEWTSGDPAPHLSTATLAVHASFEDGWGYAPAEAHTTGLPLAVSDQTGMKEILDGSPREAILPIGDEGAWTRWLRDSFHGAAP